MNIWRNTIALAAIFFLGFSLGKDYTVPRDFQSIPTEGFISQIDFGFIEDLLQIADDKYVLRDKIEDNSLTYEMARGAIKGLGDEHSSFFTPDEATEFLIAVNGELSGIGAEVGERDGRIIVISPLRGSPAEEAGLLAMDTIVAVDDFSLDGVSVEEAVKHIRGEPGTVVRLMIARKDTEAIQAIEITRDRIQVPSVEVETLTGGVVYLRLNQFDADTDQEFGAAIDELDTTEPGKLILDLRNNPGGYMDAAISVLGEFLSRDQVAVIREWSDSEEVMQARGVARLADWDVIVLINAGSASASEIVAGALQDYEIAKLMGKKSYGKGTVQEYIPFQQDSGIRITVAKWYTPYRRWVEKVGLEPDIVVDITEADRDEAYDRQLEDAKAYLWNL